MGLEGLRTISLGGGGGVGPPGPSSSVGAQDTDSIATILTSPGSSNIFSANLLLSPVGATTGFLSIDNSVNSGSSPGLVSQIQAYPVYEAVSSVLQLTGITTQVPGATFSIQVNQASGTTSGFLSFTDWNTFNSKQSALAVTDLTSSTPGMSIGNGISAVLGSAPVTVDMQQSGAAADGYLSSTDWNTFNNKQDLIGYTAAPVDTTIGGTYPLYGGGDLSANRLIAMDPATSATAGFMDITAQTFGGDKTFLGFINSPILQLQGASSGFISNIAGSSFVGYTLSWPIDQGLTNTVLANDGQGGLTWAMEANVGVTNALLLAGVSSGIFTQTVGPSFADYSITWPLAQGVTNSILLNDGQGDLVWEPTAGNSLNYQESTSSGTFSSGSGSYVDVTNLSVTLTTSGNPVIIMCIADGDATGGNESQFQADAAGDTAEMAIAILEGSTIIAQHKSGESDVLPTATDQSIPSSSVKHFYTPMAGTYTWKVQIKVITGASAAANYVKLVAYELIAPAVISSPRLANEVVSAGDSGSFNTASGSYVDVTNLTVNITTNGGRIIAVLMPTNADDLSNVQITRSAADATGYFGLHNGTSIIGSDKFSGFDTAGGTNAVGVFVPSAVSFTDNPGAGSHTYKIQAKTDNGATLNVNDCVLLVYELIAPVIVAPAGLPTILARYSYDTTNGYGSGNNKVRKWTNNSISTDPNGILTIDNNSTNGFSITANVRVRLSISYTDIGSGSMEIGIVKNGNQGTTIIQSVTNSTVIARGAAPANNLPNGISVTDIAEIGDYYWSQTDGTTAAAANTEAGIFILAEQIS